MKRIYSGMLMTACLVSTHAMAQLPFAPIDTNFTTNTVVIPASPLKYDTLFIGNYHYSYIDGGADSALAKQNHDFIGIVPEGAGNKKSWFIVNHEITNTKNTKLGDGGGMTSFYAKKENNKWVVKPKLWNKKFINVDFSQVGGTNTNCGGFPTLYGTTLSAEEFPVSSNAQLWASGAGFSDTSDFTIPSGNGPYSGKTIKRWQQMGWMVEAIPSAGIATKKYYAMGRFSHEGGVAMSDGKTVYLTDDFTPGLLCKFVADKKNDYTTGQLYAYKQGAAGNGGSWIALPMELDSLLITRDVALRRGATMFNRNEWIVTNADETKLYWTETGADVGNFQSGVALGGEIAYEIQHLDTINGSPADNILTDYYGRVWAMDLNTLDAYTLIEGGTGSDGITNFSSPDGLAITKIKGTEYLVINEDLIGISQNRNPTYVTSSSNTINEVYFLDLSIQYPTVDDLNRFLIGPKGCETTGGVFTKNGDNYFVNIQHPNTANPFPFNNSTTIVVSGFKAYLEQLKEAEEVVENALPKGGSTFSIYPNPATRQLYFNKTTDVKVIDINGAIVSLERNVNTIDISNLKPGIYFVQTIDGEVQKLIVQ